MSYLVNKGSSRSKVEHRLPESSRTLTSKVGKTKQQSILCCVALLCYNIWQGLYRSSKQIRCAVQTCSSCSCCLSRTSHSNDVSFTETEKIPDPARDAVLIFPTTRHRHSATLPLGRLKTNKQNKTNTAGRLTRDRGQHQHGSGGQNGDGMRTCRLPVVLEVCQEGR